VPCPSPGAARSGCLHLQAPQHHLVLLHLTRLLPSPPTRPAVTAAAAAADQHAKAAKTEAAGTDEDDAAADAGKDRKGGGPKRYTANRQMLREQHIDASGSAGRSRCAELGAAVAAVNHLEAAVGVASTGKYTHLHCAAAPCCQWTPHLSTSVGVLGFRV